MFGDRDLEKIRLNLKAAGFGLLSVRSTLTLWNGDNDYAANLSNSNRAALKLMGIFPRYLSCIILLAMGQSIATRLFISIAVMTI